MSELYLRSVRKLLDCPAAKRDRLMKRLSDAVTTYLEDYPDAKLEQMIQAFGTPEICASQLLDDCQPAVVVNARQKKHRRMRAGMIILAIFLSLTLLAAGYLWSNGGLVIIEHTHYADDIPENFPTDGEGSIEYHFDE